eukprot:scaffold4492_cov371-Prasinococcus_capsulatus_cf.AAC.4
MQHTSERASCKAEIRPAAPCRPGHGATCVSVARSRAGCVTCRRPAVSRHSASSRTCWSKWPSQSVAPLRRAACTAARRRNSPTPPPRCRRHDAPAVSASGDGERQSSAGSDRSARG